MPFSTELIKPSVDRYLRERDRYVKLAARVADLCRTEIIDADAIRAQVTSRAKTTKSFESKLQRFSKMPNKNYTSVDQVFDEIGDFAGVRVAVYQPEDEKRVADKVAGFFAGSDGGSPDVDEKNKLNEKESSFYRSTHCQVTLPEDTLIGADDDNLKGASCEIQICSMMAHVWNEIEHDIGYKPAGGGPGHVELGLLKSLGHLTRSGDAAITQLLLANEERLKEQSGEFLDSFDFVARMRSSIEGGDISDHSGQLFEELKLLDITTPDSLFKSAPRLMNDLAGLKDEIIHLNHFVDDNGDTYYFEEDSSDIILLALLERYSNQIIDNHPTGRGLGRSPRIRTLAKSYNDFQKQDS